MQTQHQTKTYSVVMPVALTQLYVKAMALRPSISNADIQFNCIFEDDPEKISQLQPDLTIRLINYSSPLKRDRECDLIVRRLIVASPSLLGRRSITKFKELEAFPFATVERLGYRYFFLKTLANETMVIEPKTVFASNNIFAAHEAAKHGIAFTVLPEFMVQDDINAGTLISLFPRCPPQPYLVNVIMAQTHAGQKPLKHLADALLKKLQALQGIETQYLSYQPRHLIKPQNATSQYQNSTKENL